jgi:hypothetical protein
MRRLLRFGLVLLVLVLLAGHYLYWYGERERPMVPDPQGLPFRVFASGTYDVCLWTPYPHQNVGALGESVDDGAVWLGAAARLAGAPPPVLPSFGPFALPPSHEIAVCSDMDGKRYMAAARVYPVLGAVARLAGRIADNPWLAGGEVSEVEATGSGPIERRSRVEWRDDLWTLTSGEAPDFGTAPAGTPKIDEPLLGMLHLREEVSQFPAGFYRLHRREGDLQMELERPSNEADAGLARLAGFDLTALGGDSPALLALAGPAWPADSDRPLPPAAFALFDTRDGIHVNLLEDLPGAAVLHPEGTQRWQLPGQSVIRLLAGGLPKGNAAGWDVVALDTASLRRGRALAPRLSGLVPLDSTGAAGSNGRLILGLWFQPGPTRQVVGRIRQVLQKIPLVDRDQVRRWRDGEIVLQPLAACQQVTLAATETPASFRLRFHRCGS